LYARRVSFFTNKDFHTEEIVIDLQADAARTSDRTTSTLLSNASFDVPDGYAWPYCAYT
jgi:hypothetical protein